MYLTLVLILSISLVNVSCDKSFRSVPVVVKTYENDTVLLPCYVEDTDSKLRVRWYKGETLLGDSYDAHHLLPPRYRMHANFSLQIDSLRSEDTAEYVCEVIRPEPWGPVRQIHSVEVQYSPSVRTVPDDGYLEVRKGEYVDIGCDVTGSPEPVVNWRKNGEALALLDHRSRLRFKAEHRLLAGVYECVADNGIGDPVIAVVRVIVQDAPVVSTERSFVHTAVGLRAALVANLEFSAPTARTSWYKEGRPVKTDDRVVLMVQDTIHQLIFRSVRKSDLGNYTFRAENMLGMADVSFKLTGVPNLASFKIDAALNKATSTSFSLIWEVDSYTPIIEYNLWLRPYYGRLSTEEDTFTTGPSGILWSKIVVPGDVTDGPLHSAKYVVRSLTPSTVYEAVVTSRNMFGWSKPSSILHFATEPLTGRIRLPSVTPLLEEPLTEPNQTPPVSERYDDLPNGNNKMAATVRFIILSICFCKILS